ncbi:hypothetical protein BDY21DRAFT_368737 [Lineolata rhizophorae]|uniref:Uncharacterized protein n=1 Tax=Lineolata rhizophorae TaxID=578093 RepID=A0A6A6PC67_9PEZI|nr:hypothetical protein BDY21DRAFT_368737 [Lineolata rhizophorae]
MPFGRRSHARTTRRTNKPTLMDRLRGNHGPTHTTSTRRTRHSPTQTTTTTTTTKQTTTTAHPPVASGAGAAPVRHHQRRRPSIGDKVSGAMMRLKGSLTRRPGKKAAGTRRMHGTDGRGRRRRF